MLVGLLVWVAADVVPARAATPPSGDPFYRPPRRLAAARPGTIFRSRQVTVRLGAAQLAGGASSAYQLLYRTNDAKNRPVANVTTVIVPNGAPPAGSRVLLSLQDAENSLDSDCAPSYQLQEGEMAPTGDNNGNLAAEMSAVAVPQLAAGHVVVVPDPEGPQHQYTVSRMAAHAVLDSIRAVERFGPAGLSGSKTPVALAGYSGGALESAAANESQPAYAPELNIVAVAAGGVPSLDIDNFRYLDGGVATGILMAAATAIDRAYPEMRLESLLNAKGKAFQREASEGCAAFVFAAPFAHFNDWTTKPHALDLPRVRKIVAENAFGHAVPKAPTFYYNGIFDELIWIKPLDRLVAFYCAHGATISYFRDPAGVEHIQAVANWGPMAHAYIEQRFAGTPPPSTCGQALNASPTPQL